MFVWGFFWGWWITFLVTWYGFSYIYRRKVMEKQDLANYYRQNYCRLRLQVAMKTGEIDELKDI